MNRKRKPDDEIRIYEEQEGQFDTLIQLLPKTMRQRATVLLHSLSGKIKVDNDNNVIYPSGEIGSHLLGRYIRVVLP